MFYISPMKNQWNTIYISRKLSLLCQRRNVFRLIVLSLCALVIFNEYLVHLISSSSWPKMKCGDLKKLHTVLLVADPQILGEKSEPWLARWDNDRYLKHSFASAVHHARPELIVFLGDLLDEGSVASDEQYQRYFLRFKNIFQLDSASTLNKSIFIPGDNDIGGEDELVTEKKVSRFKRFFYSPVTYQLGNIQFVQVDKMQRLVPPVPPLPANDNLTRVVISHMPLLSMPSAFAAEVLQKLRPQLILSAHEHKSLHFSADIETGERNLIEILKENSLADMQSSWRFQRPDHVVNEVVVPTCSYRMGVADMAYSVALFDQGGQAVCYHVLWLSSRFYTLGTYIIALVMMMLVTLFHLQCCQYLCCLRQKRSPLYRHA